MQKITIDDIKNFDDMWDDLERLSHQRNWHAVLLRDDVLITCTHTSVDNESEAEWLGREIRLLTIGTGSDACNCDVCANGEDIDEYIGNCKAELYQGWSERVDFALDKLSQRCDG